MLREITVLNKTQVPIPIIFIYSTKFMPGLKVTDETGRELPFLTNQYTKKILARFPKHRILLKLMEAHKLFVLWVKLPENDPVNPDQLKILKLAYHDNTEPQPSKINPLKDQRFLFSIPEFTDEYEKPEGIEYDLFIVVDVPEGNIVSRNELVAMEFVKQVNKSPTKIDEKIEEKILNEKDGLYTGDYRNSMSIRVPPLKEKINFKMTYSVLPSLNERLFFVTAVFFLIGFSLFLSVLSAINIDYDEQQWLLFLEPFQDNLEAFYGGLVTACFAAIGLIRNPIMNKTRFWFLIPIIISAIGFMIMNYDSSGSVTINITG
jgi:hypothetical protein